MTGLSSKGESGENNSACEVGVRRYLARILGHNVQLKLEINLALLPLELAIRNQTDRFSLAIDAIDRMPRFRVTSGSSVKSTPTSSASIDPTSRIGSGHFRSRVSWSGSRPTG